jgi:hypothetical protein
MKSNNALIVMALVFLIFATASSVVLWADVSSPVKIGMFACGFGAGVMVGTWIARRRSAS